MIALLTLMPHAFTSLGLLVCFAHTTITRTYRLITVLRSGLDITPLPILVVVAFAIIHNMVLAAFHRIRSSYPLSTWKECSRHMLDPVFCS
jgi:hypothetical protein